MNNQQKVALKQNRLQTLNGNGKNTKSPGVVRKLEREIRNLQSVADKS